jgi:3-hydroxyisobutyrate dehydrogenase
MGLGMAQSMVKSGMRVAGFDLNSAAVAKLVNAGGSGTSSVAEVAKGADILLVVVVNAAQTDAVLFGENGAAAAMKRGGVIISSATMAPDDARKLAAKAEARPAVSRCAHQRSGQSAIGQLTVMASGPKNFRADPLDAIATTVYELAMRASALRSRW